MEENLTVFAESSPVQATAKLTIKDFIEVMTTSKPGEVFNSDTFMVGNIPMTIAVYPNGNMKVNEGYVSVFLFNKSDVAVTAKCQFVTDAKTKGFDGLKVNRTMGYKKFLSHSECRPIYKEKDFTLTANVEIPGKGLKIVGKETATLPKNHCVCNNLYDKMERSDFSIICNNGVEVACHKIVLSAASPVFAAMVENQHREAIEGKVKIDISGDVGQAFVKYMYTGHLEESMLKEQSVIFLQLGDKYDVQELKSLAEAEMLKQLDKKNMVEFASVGDFHNANKIFEAALKMMKSNMAWLRSQEGGMESVMGLSKETLAKLL